MTPRRLVSLMGWAVVAPVAAVAALSFATSAPKPCFIAGTHAYRIADSGHESYAVEFGQLAAGEHTISLRTFDSSGNVGTLSVTVRR